MKAAIKMLSENPLQIALVENKDLKEQLAKANERVNELEVELGVAIEFIESCDFDYNEAVEQLRKE